MVVAIDGPVASGKGRMVELLSKKLDLETLDTGAIYRVITIAMLNNSFEYNDYSEENTKKLKEILATLDIEVINEAVDGEKIQRYFLNGEDVTKKIRDKETTEHVSFVSSNTIIRLYVTDFTRKYAEGRNIIMDGRDIGTYVFPNADVKIYLTADPEIRAKRRYEQNLEKNQNNMTYEEVLENLKARDYNDMYNKEIGALKQADDAILVDNTNHTEEETLQILFDIIKKKM